MAFTAKILSWRFRHLNIVVCWLKRRPTKGGHRHHRTLLATPLLSKEGEGGEGETAFENKRGIHIRLKLESNS